MSTPVISRQMSQLLASLSAFFAFATDSTWARRRFEPGVADFTIGNPHEMPLPAVAAALQRWSAPQDKDWFGYKMSEPAAVAAVAASLRERRGVAFAAEDIIMTTGGFAGLSVALRAVVDAGDEVIFISPPWFFYAPLIAATGATPVRVKVRPDDFDLDLAAIETAITPRTRAIIVNSPHNPTGMIYPPATLAALGHLLTAASARHGRPIWLLSDEAYSRIIFDGRPYPSPTSFYPYSFLIYTYGKTLLTPGQRLGYLALPPELPAGERAALRPAITMAQVVTGYAWPNAVMQYALPELERLSIDVGHLQRKRDRLVAALRALGYHVHVPQGTFYLLVQSPLADDLAFAEALAARDVFVLPGTICEAPGYFRLSLTANEAMIERALPVFAAAIEQTAGTGRP
jgi:aspartate aminotransferase